MVKYLFVTKKLYIIYLLYIKQLPKSHHCEVGRINVKERDNKERKVRRVRKRNGRGKRCYCRLEGKVQCGFTATICIVDQMVKGNWVGNPLPVSFFLFSSVLLSLLAHRLPELVWKVFTLCSDLFFLRSSSSFFLSLEL